ncbi:MAG TPA: ion transporter [Chloroflexota bacterium]|nr:ion transporter [Chloroflexota bacterium]
MRGDPDDARRQCRRQRWELLQRLSDWLDAPLTALALIMLGLMVAELALPLSPAWARRVTQAETAIWIVFLADFLLEFALAPSKLHYLKRNWLTAVAVVLPTLRAVRVLRVARALRGMSLLRLLTTLNRGSRALGHIVRRGQLGYVLLLTVSVVATAAAGAYYLEHDEPGALIKTPGEAIWWAATLVTTMNSSLDTVTVEGQVVSLLLRVFALGVSGYVTAVIAVYLLGAPRQPEEGPDQPELAALRAEVAALRALVERRLPPPDSAVPPAEALSTAACHPRSARAQPANPAPTPEAPPAMPHVRSR